MNIVDKAISVISPQSALKRMVAREKLKMMGEIVNTGYSEGGASYTKKEFKGNDGHFSKSTTGH